MPRKITLKKKTKIKNAELIKNLFNKHNLFADTLKRLDLPLYVNSNNKNFPQFINENFIDAKMDILSDYPSNTISLAAKNHQRFVANYLSDNTPYKSVLLYHGLGSGKTAASILTAEGNINKKYIVLAPASLKVNYIDEVAKFANIFNDDADEIISKFNWFFLPITNVSKFTKILQHSFFNKMITKKIFNKLVQNGGIYLIENTSLDEEAKKIIRIVSEDNEHYESDKTNIKTQIKILKENKEIIRKLKYNTYSYDANKYTLINIFEKELPEEYKEHLLKKTVDSSRSKSSITKEDQLDFLDMMYDTSDENAGIYNPFDNKIIIVDEIHNLVSKIHNKSFYGLKLYELIMRSKNSKCIFLSGTPVINFPYELGILCNMLKGLIRVYEFNFEGSEQNIKELLNTCYFIDRYKLNNSKLLITLPPHNFKRKFDVDGNYEGLIKYTVDENNINEDNLYISLRDLLISQGITINEPFKKKYFSIFPGMFNEEITRDSNGREEFIKSRKDIENDIDSFNNFYIDSDEVAIKNELNFKNRVIGLVSFYNEIISTDDSIIFPEKITASKSETLVEMSDYQFIHYSKERERERKLEKISRKQSNANSILDKQPSYFKVFSRQAGIFVFPPNIIRPRKNREIIQEEIKEVIDPTIDEPSESANLKDYDTQLNDAILELDESNLSVNSTEDNLYNLAILSPKYTKILENIYNTNGNIFIYSQYRSVEGVGIFTKVLNIAGFKQYLPDEEHNTIINIGDNVRYIEDSSVLESSSSFKFGKIIKIDTNSYTIKKYQSEQNITIIYNNATPNIFPCRYILWTGTEGHDERKKSLDYFNKETNKYGKLCLILITTETGAEGISLKCVRQVHIMEPYWNNVRKKQVIGRARRVLSHDTLNDDEKNVKIFEYTIKYSQAQLNPTKFKNQFLDTLGSDATTFNLAHIEQYTKLLQDDYSYDIKEKIENITDSMGDTITELEKTEFINKLIKKTHNSILQKISDLCGDINLQDSGKTSDEVLNDIAEKKEIILNKLLFIIKQSAIDCQYNLSDNRMSDPENLRSLQCYNNIQSSSQYNFKLQSVAESSKDTDISLLKNISSAKNPIKVPINIPGIGIISVLMFKNDSFDSIDELPENITKIYDYYTYRGFNPNLDISTRGTEEVIGKIIKNNGKITQIKFNNSAIAKNFELYKIIENTIQEHQTTLNKDLSQIENINHLRVAVVFKTTEDEGDSEEEDVDEALLSEIKGIKCPSCSDSIKPVFINGAECAICEFPREAAVEFWD